MLLLRGRDFLRWRLPLYQQDTFYTISFEHLHLPDDADCNSGGAYGFDVPDYGAAVSQLHATAASGGLAVRVADNWSRRTRPGLFTS